MRSHTHSSSCSFSKKGTSHVSLRSQHPWWEEGRLCTCLMLSWQSLSVPLEIYLFLFLFLKMWLNHWRLEIWPGIYASPFIMLHPLLTTLQLHKSRREAFTPQNCCQNEGGLSRLLQHRHLESTGSGAHILDEFTSLSLPCAKSQAWKSCIEEIKSFVQLLIMHRPAHSFISTIEKGARVEHG